MEALVLNYTSEYECTMDQELADAAACGSCMPNFKSASFTIFQQLAFNAQNATGHIILALTPFEKCLVVLCHD